MRTLARTLTPLVLLLAGCGGVPEHTTAERPAVGGNDGPAGKRRSGCTLREANARFAGRLYATLAQDGGNLVFSPYSISAALAMTSAGARGETLAQLERATGCGPVDDVHSAFGRLGHDLAARQGDGFRLDVANSLWGQRGMAFEQPFLDTLAHDYGSPLNTVDYRAAPDAARGDINSWVAHRTNGMIPELLGQGTITRQTRFALVNAVYLKADWAAPFEPEETGLGTFHSPGGPVRTRFMHDESTNLYADGDGFQAVELPYSGEKVVMDVVLPDRGAMAAVERRVAGGRLESLFSGLSPVTLDLALPKLDLSERFELTAALGALGVHDLFTGAADLGAITRDEPISIASAIHQAVLKVDEKGTEAAAATAMIGKATSAPGGTDPIAMHVDRPFLLVIRDRPTGTVLFMARIEDPAAAATT